MLKAFWRFQAAQRKWRLDYVFFAFLLCVAGSVGREMLALKERRALDHALSTHLLRLDECVAALDVACATQALDEARVIEPSHPRIEIAQAAIEILRGQLARAEATLKAWDRKSGKLSRRGRIELLLAQGDLELARGDESSARAKLGAVSSLEPGNESVSRRLERIDRKSSDAKEGIRSLRAEVDQLFLDAGSGETDAVSKRREALNARLYRLPRIAREKLLEALSRAASAAWRMRSPGSSSGSPSYVSSTPAPTRPTLDPSLSLNDQAQKQHERDLERYERERAYWEAREQEIARRRAESATRRSAGYMNDGSTELTRARALAEEAFAALGPEAVAP